MKKYLMTGIAALAMCAGFTSCSHDLSMPTQEDINQYVAQKVTDNYNRAFVDHFGEPSEDQDWGFGSASSARALTRANTGDSYPATHEYTDANGNVIAGANMNSNEWADPNKGFGGWVVPDPLTEGQKLRVQKYFQANPNLSYEDPHYRHFFVQQVYTGGSSAPQTGNKESTKAANGSTYNATNMNQLTVGEANSHINNFNAGTRSTSNVLDNGKTVNNGTYHSDQITLMVNVYDTSCFGYHDTGGSNVKGKINHNDKMALVSAAIIDAWAARNGNPGEAVVDKWNRSFMGFDHELLPESDIVMDSYAQLNAVPNLNNIPYAWDGEKVMKIGQAPAAVAAGTEVDLTGYFANCYNGSVTNNANGIVFTSNGWGGLQAWSFGDANKWANYTKFVIEFKEATQVASEIQLGAAGNHNIAAGTTKYELDLTDITAEVSSGTLVVSNPGTINISKIYLITGAQQDNTVYYNPTYLLGDAEADKISFYSANTNMYGGIIRDLSENEMKTTQDGKTCLDLTLFKQLVADGYHPVSTDLKKWVKWQAACDGYYSDWIVTLTEAKRYEEEEEDFDVRIIAEDLTPGEDLDWDFNDVVFDVTYTSDTEATCTIQCAGGVLPLRVATKGNPGDGDWIEVHEKYGKERKANGKYDMINTGGASITINDKPTFTVTGISKGERGKDIKIMVDKGTVNEPNWIEITATKGQPAAKIAVNKGYKIVTERTDIRTVYTKFSEWVSDPKIIWY